MTTSSRSRCRPSTRPGRSAAPARRSGARRAGTSRPRRCARAAAGSRSRRRWPAVGCGCSTGRAAAAGCRSATSGRSTPTAWRGARARRRCANRSRPRPSRVTWRRRRCPGRVRERHRLRGDLSLKAFTEPGLATKWGASVGALSSPSIANGVVYAMTMDTQFRVRPAAFDAAGVQGCSGSPNTCAPLWSGPAVQRRPVGHQRAVVAADRRRRHALRALGRPPARLPRFCVETGRWGSQFLTQKRGWAWRPGSSRAGSGGTTGSRSRGGRTPRARPGGAPNVLLVVLDDVGFAQLGCFGSDIETPTFDRLAAGGLRYANFHTTALCSPTRACLLTGRNHHTCGMGRITDLATGFPGYDARIPRRCGVPPGMLTPHGYAAYAVGQVAPHPRGRGAPRRAGATAGRSAGASSASTGSSAARRTSSRPPSSTTTTASSRRGRLDDGYHLTEDLADRAIEFVDRPAPRRRPTSRCSSTSRPAPATRRTRRRAEWIERYRGQFDARLGRVARARRLARQIELGLLPAQHRAVAAPRVGAGVGLAAGRRAAALRPVHGGVRRLPLAHRRTGRPASIALLERVGRARRHAGAGAVRQRRVVGGRPDGSLNDVRLWNGLPRDVEEAAERIDEIGGPRIHNNYPWGWTVAGNTPFRRWKREMHEGGVADPLIVHWPRGHRRPAARCAASTCTPSTSRPPCSRLVGIEAPAVIDGVEQTPIEGVSFALLVRRRRTRPSGTPTSTTRCSAAGRSTTTGGRRSPTTTSRSRSPGSTRRPWELYDVRADPSRVPRPRGRRARAAGRRWSSGGGRRPRRHQVLPLDNRPFSDFVFDRPTDVRGRARATVLAGRGAGARERGASNVRNRPHDVTAHVDRARGRRRRRGRARRAGLGARRLVVPPARRRAALLRAQPRRARRSTGWRRPSPLDARAATTSASATGPASRRRGRCSSTARWSAPGEITQVGVEPLLDHRRRPHRRLVARPPAGRPRTTTGRSAFTGTVERAWIDVDGEPFVDPEAEADAAIARQ